MLAAAPVTRYAPVSLEHTNVVALRVHSANDCGMLDAGWPCPVHNLTDHPMRAWPQVMTADGFGRVCPDHNVVHPDPDDLTVVSHDDCCGCCAILDWDDRDLR